MKSFKTIVTTVLVTTCVVSVLIGCQGKANKDEKKEAETVVENTTEASNAELKEFKTEKYTMSYDPAYFELFEGENDGEATFSYNHEGDEVAGSNVVMITIFKDTDAMTVVKDYMALYDATEDEMVENYLGGDDVKGYSYSTGVLESEGSELKMCDTYYTVPCGNDVILINSLRTMGDNMEFENSIDEQIVNLILTFKLN